jgi:hypothetical protein
MSHEEAARVLDATLNFLVMCVSYPGHSFTPSPLVDAGWHTFLLYTREYREWCEALAGRFIDHCPTDVDCSTGDISDATRTCGPDKCSCDPGRCCNYSDAATSTLGDTIAFMDLMGIKYDVQMWTRSESGS